MIFIGKLLKTRGNKGELVLSYFPYINFSAIKKGISLDLISDKYEKEFVLENFKLMGNNKLIVKFKSIDDISSALGLVGYSVYMKGSEEKRIKKDFIDYEVFDMNKNKLGIIVGIVSSGKNELLEVKSKDNEFLIPLATELIKEVNKKENYIIVDLPEGLVDLNK